MITKTITRWKLDIRLIIHCTPDMRAKIFVLITIIIKIITMLTFNRKILLIEIL